MQLRLTFSSILKTCILLFLGLSFIVLMALKKLTIPGTSIQMSLQSLSISLLVIALEKKAWKSVLIYLLLATTGLPILAGASKESAWFLLPSAGYYIGFLLSALLLPRIISKIKPKTFIKSWFCFSSNETMILLCGYLVLILHAGFRQAFWMGVYPYLLVAILKITIATGCYKLKLFAVRRKLVFPKALHT